MSASEVATRASVLIALLGVIYGSACTPGAKATAADPQIIISRYNNPDKGIAHLRLWRELGITSPLFADNIDPGPITGELYTLGQSDNNLWKMIRLKDLFGSDWQFLLFTHTDSGWAFAGQIDFPPQPYEEPSWRFVPDSNGQARLVVRYISNYGTEVYEKKEAWYTLHRSGLIKERETEPTSDSTGLHAP